MNFGSPVARPFMAISGVIALAVAVGVGAAQLSDPNWRFVLISLIALSSGLTYLGGALQGVRIRPGRSVGGTMLIGRADLQEGERVVEFGSGIARAGAPSAWDRLARHYGSHVFLTDRRIIYAPYAFVLPVSARPRSFGLSTITRAEAADDWLGPFSRVSGVILTLTDGSIWTVTSDYKPLASRLAALQPAAAPEPLPAVAARAKRVSGIAAWALLAFFGVLMAARVIDMPSAVIWGVVGTAAALQLARFALNR